MNTLQAEPTRDQQAKGSSAWRVCPGQLLCTFYSARNLGELGRMDQVGINDCVVSTNAENACIWMGLF